MSANDAVDDSSTGAAEVGRCQTPAFGQRAAIIVAGSEHWIFQVMGKSSAMELAYGGEG
jgi:hypothetical protein